MGEIMANTYKYEDALALCQRYGSKVDDGLFASQVCNIATNLIWMAFDWRESLATLPPFYLIGGEQDYPLPTSSLPTDFHSLRQIYLTRLNDGNPVRDLLVNKNTLELTHLKSIPRCISYEPSIGGFRLFPRPSENMGAPQWLVEGTYKKRPVQITQGTLNTLLPFDDLYIQVWLDAMIYAYRKLQGAESGDVTYQNGNRVYTGQLAKAMAAIEEMACQEGIQGGEYTIAPAEPLSQGSFSFSNNLFIA